MKRIITLLSVVLFTFGAFSLQSCKKCSTCTYTYQVAGETKQFTYPELCGSKSDIDDYEQACSVAAAAVGGTCSCN
jgi:hypothetical protein